MTERLIKNWPMYLLIAGFIYMGAFFMIKSKKGEDGKGVGCPEKVKIAAKRK